MNKSISVVIDEDDYWLMLQILDWIHDSSDYISGFVGIKSDYKNSSLVLFISEIYFNLQVETDDSCRSEEQQNQRCVTNQSYQWSLTSEGVAVVINQNVCVCSINHGGKTLNMNMNEYHRWLAWNLPQAATRFLCLLWKWFL